MNKKSIIIILILIIVILGISTFSIKQKNKNYLEGINLVPPEKLPQNFPSWIPFFGFKKTLQNYETEIDNKLIQSTRQFVSAFLPNNIYNQYKIFLLERGWSIISESREGTGKLVLMANKDNQTINVYVEEVLDLQTNKKDTVVTLYFFKPKQ
jgi:uncharacterized SAM-binding protein YcdF (DUF218 family)